MLQQHPHHTQRPSTPPPLPPAPQPPPPLVAAGRFAVTQLRALRWALTATGAIDIEVVHDYLLGIETGLRHALGEPLLLHVEPGART